MTLVTSTSTDGDVSTDKSGQNIANKSMKDKDIIDSDFSIVT